MLKFMIKYIIILTLLCVSVSQNELLLFAQLSATSMKEGKARGRIKAVLNQPKERREITLVCTLRIKTGASIVKTNMKRFSKIKNTNSPFLYITAFLQVN